MHLFPVSALALCLALPGLAFAQTGSAPAAKASGAAVAPAQIFEKLLSAEEKDLVSAAEAMPADKFDFAPAKSPGNFDGVKTFSAQVKHVAEANYGFFHGFGVSGGKTRAELEKVNGRDGILQALKDSYTYAHSAMATITAQNAFVDMDGKGTTRAGMAAYSLQHNNDHYGQMVEYLRMNGIIPPASRH